MRSFPKILIGSVVNNILLIHTSLGTFIEFLLVSS